MKDQKHFFIRIENSKVKCLLGHSENRILLSTAER